MSLRRSLATVGTMVGDRYRIAGRIGSGSMASIYLAVDTDDMSHVAVKLLHPALADDEIAIARFKREAKAAHGFHHPGAVRVHAWGFQDEIPYIVMELAEGENLYQYLQRHGRLSQLTAIAVGRQLCDVLDAAHSMGFVHRDLKPENIMVLANEADSTALRIKVLDFGVVKFLPGARGRLPGEPQKPAHHDDTDSGPESLTNFGMTVGTPTHMAPEQARSRKVDTRADLYTSGVLLFEMCTGELPFDSANPLEVTRMHVQDAPPTPRSLVAEIHPELEHIILTCLAKEPARRIQTARELGRQLTRVQVILNAEGDPTEARLTPSAPLSISTKPQRSTLPTAPAFQDPTEENDENDEGLNDAFSQECEEESPAALSSDQLRHALPPVARDTPPAVDPSHPTAPQVQTSGSAEQLATTADTPPDRSDSSSRIKGLAIAIGVFLVAVAAAWHFI